MFGFLPGPCGCASSDDHSAWRSHFCGLCNTLRGRYGLWSRWLINRDSTFLALAGSALAAEEPAGTLTSCCNPLGRKRLLVQHEPQMRFAAAVTICGLAVKLRDDAGDERGWRRRAAKGGSWLLRRAEGKARADLAALGFPVDHTARLIGGQAAVESPGASLEEAVAPVAQTYARIFGHAAAVAENPAGAAALEDAGAALGRLIYTVDAWEDYEQDRRRGRFNPLPPQEASRRALVTEAVERDLAVLPHALGALPLRRFGGLMERLTGPLLRARTLQRLGMEPPAQPPPIPPESPPVPPPIPDSGWPDDPPKEKSKRLRSGRSREKKCCGVCEGCNAQCNRCCGRSSPCDCCMIPCDCDCGNGGGDGCNCGCDGCDCGC